MFLLCHPRVSHSETGSNDGGEGFRGGDEGPGRGCLGVNLGGGGGLLEMRQVDLLPRRGEGGVGEVEVKIKIIVLRGEGNYRVPMSAGVLLHYNLEGGGNVQYADVCLLVGLASPPTHNFQSSIMD